MAGPLLKVEGLRIAIGGREIVRGASLEVAKGEVVGLVGESGSGKSLTALSVMRLLPPRAVINAGSIAFDGRLLNKMSDSEINRMRGRDISMIFQDPLTALNPVISVGRQIFDSLRTHQSIGRRAAWSQAEELLALVGIPYPKQRARAYPHELSGGMRQRVMTALAVANNPRLLIADEPTTALDVTVQAQIMEMLEHIRRELGIAVLFISHNLDLIAQICDRVSVMYAGRIVECGDVESVFERPLHPYSRQLLRCIPRLNGEKGPMPTIPGLPPRPGVVQEACPFAPRCDVAQPRCVSEAPPIYQEADHWASCWAALR